MKRATLSIIVLALLVAVLLIATGFTAASTVNAQLGNVGVPVTCNVGVAVAPNAYRDLSCYAADGTYFVNGHNVPEGHYFLVTDAGMTPISATPQSMFTFIRQMVGTDAVYALRLATPTGGTVSEHFTVPYLVLRAGESLRAFNDQGSTAMADFYVSGLLTTNYTYAPLITR